MTEHKLHATTVSVLHRKPGYSENVKFISYYPVESDASESELVDLFAKAFAEAHPECMILEVKVS